MGRRKPKHFQDEDFDSSDSNGGNSDNDFEGLNADERDEARLFQNKRRGKKFTKEDAALGIFADDDEDDKRGSFRGANGVANIAFVKTTQKEDSSDSDNNSIDAMDVDEDEDGGSDEGEKVPRNRDEEEDASVLDERPAGLGLGFNSNNNSSESINSNPHTGLGFGNSRGGLGSAPPLPPKTNNTKPPASSNKTNNSNTNKPQPSVVLDARKQQINASRLNPTPDKDFMKFDKEGKGLSFLLKMGYKKGSGLGKEGQGIVNPIDVKLRPQKMGLGHRGFDERTQTVKLEQQMKRAERGETATDSEDDDTPKPVSKKDKVAKVAVDQWKRVGGKKKGKVSYKTAEELIQESAGSASVGGGSVDKQTKIIDMTGAQARELNNMAELASGAQISALREAASHLVELRYNVRTMASEAEIDLIRLSKALTLENKNLARTDQEMDAMKKSVEFLGTKRARLAQVIELAQTVVEEGKKLEKSLIVRGSEASIPSEEIDAAFSSLFQRIQTEYFDEYVEHRLDSLVVGAMAPLIKRMLLNWSPLQEPHFALESFRKWRKLFRFSVKATSSGRGAVASESMRSMTPFESMMYNIWLPKVRQDVNNNWDPLNPDACTNFLEAWYPSSPSPEIIVNGGLPELANTSAPHLLPPWVHNNIINQLILPKLLSSISQWDARTDTAILPHQWLFPWLPILRIDRFSKSITEPIKNKFSLFLSEWHPSTPGALKLLSPWAQVFPTKTFETLLNKSILPKLVSTLRTEFHVNPAAQDMKPLEWVLEWRHVFPKPIFSHLIETEFFPKWIQVLWLWLGSPGVSFDEVSRWYLAWKSAFPEDMQEGWVGVSEGWKVGLDLMNRAVSGAEGDGLGPVPKLVPIAERGDGWMGVAGSGRKQEKVVTGKPDLVRRKEVAVGFLELVERTAAQVGLVLLPTGRSHTSGKPIYKLEKGDGGSRKGRGVVFYVDEGVVFVYGGGAVGDAAGDWGAIAVDEIVALALK
ncbi:UNVERIFIED_CONTAM: hypothetical protein HDU68_012779 [Siphonaria sp. JEL0065]|nr:hypothetical protein HDU68_012779 [Siphonaria sp. JEL0065]